MYNVLVVPGGAGNELFSGMPYLVHPAMQQLMQPIKNSYLERYGSFAKAAAPSTSVVKKNYFAMIPPLPPAVDERLYIATALVVGMVIIVALITLWSCHTRKVAAGRNSLRVATQIKRTTENPFCLNVPALKEKSSMHSQSYFSSRSLACVRDEDGKNKTRTVPTNQHSFKESPDTYHRSVFEEAETLLTACNLVYHFTCLRVHARRSGNEKLATALKLPQKASKLYPIVVRNIRHIKTVNTSTKADDIARRVINVLHFDEMFGTFPTPGGHAHMTSEVFFAADDEGDLKASSVYTININRSRQRITVVFRGTTMDQNESGANHWMTNFSSGLRWEGNPISDMAKDTPFYHVHQGIMRASTHSRSTILGTIDTIKQVYPETENYQLYVTGHSLGGALATLFGYYAAIDPNVTKNGPVCVYTFAAPAVGDEDFAKIIRYLEDNDRIQIARFCNSGDIVPNFHALGGKFKHVGIEIELDEASLQVKPREKQGSLVRLLKAACSPGAALAKHSCETTDDFLDEHRSKLKIMTLNDLYRQDSSSGSK